MITWGTTASCLYKIDTRVSFWHISALSRLILLNINMNKFWFSIKPRVWCIMWLNCHFSFFLSQKLVYSEDLKTLIKNSGCESLCHCVLTVTPADLSTGENLGPSNVFYPADLSEVVGLNEPQLKVSICRSKRETVVLRRWGISERKLDYQQSR